MVAVETIPTLSSAAWAYELDAVAVAASEGVYLLGDTPVLRDDGVTLYSSHIAPIRNMVVAEA